jgi:hypothetical protein
MTPGDIDRYVRDQLAAGEDLYTLDAGALAEIAPDVILTQDLCRVCARPTNHVEDALDYLGCRADVISLDPHTLDDVLDSIKILGKRLGVEQRAEKLVTGLRVRLDAVASSVAATATSSRRRTRMDRSAVHRRPLGAGPHHRRRRAAGGIRRRRTLRARHGAAQLKSRCPRNLIGASFRNAREMGVSAGVNADAFTYVGQGAGDAGEVELFGFLLGQDEQSGL